MKYVKWNVDFRSRKLSDLARGKAALVYLCLVFYQAEDGHSAPGYEAIMADTGVSASTISGALDHLEAAGLIARAGVAGNGNDRWKLLGDWTRFGRGLPEGETPESGVSAVQTPKTGVTTPESGVFEDSVVVNDSLVDQQQQQIQYGLQKLESRLQKLELDISPEQWQAWIAAHGLERVVECARWYRFALDAGRARSTGWLRRALDEGWTEPPAGFDPTPYRTAAEQAQEQQGRLRRLEELGVEM